MSSRFYLENEVPQRHAASEEQDLRGKMAMMIPNTSFAGKLDPATAPLPVLETLEKPILEEFQERATARGELVVEEYTDHRGQVCRRFHGDPAADIRQSFAAPGVTVRVAETVGFDGHVYLKDRIPNNVRAKMYARSLGAE
jgi:hypothetical protein